MIYRPGRSLFVFHLILFAIVAVVALVFTMKTTDLERQEYRNIVSEALNENLPSEYKADQKRDDIYREIVLAHKGNRIQTRITADKGILTLNQEGGRVIFTESLKNISCLMQEELFYENEKPMQRLRLINSSEALYDYSTNTLTTQQMTFKRFVAPSHQLPENVDILTPLLIGKASAAEVHFKESGPVLHAKHLKVTLPHARSN